MVGGNNLDFLAEERVAEILCREAGRRDGADAAIVGEDAGLVVQDADPDDVACRLRGIGNGKYAEQ